MWEYVHVCADLGTHQLSSTTCSSQAQIISRSSDAVAFLRRSAPFILFTLLVLRNPAGRDSFRAAEQEGQLGSRERERESEQLPTATQKNPSLHCFKSCSSITTEQSDKIRAQNSAADTKGRSILMERMHPVTQSVSPWQLNHHQYPLLRKSTWGGNKILCSGHEFDEDAASLSLYLMEFTHQ